MGAAKLPGGGGVGVLAMVGWKNGDDCGGTN